MPDQPRGKLQRADSLRLQLGPTREAGVRLADRADWQRRDRILDWAMQMAGGDETVALNYYRAYVNRPTLKTGSPPSVGYFGAIAAMGKKGGK